MKISRLIQRLFTSPLTWLVALILAFAFTRVFSLTALPVFADESIYIRWAQLITHDSKYLFFSLNDGKPPLFIWSLIPALQLISDPLLAARLVSASVGLLQLSIILLIIRKLSKKDRSFLIGGAIVVLTPFWFFHQRMALMDGLLTLGLSISWLGMLHLDTLSDKIVWSRKRVMQLVLAIVLSGTGWGLALWTKTPALFFAPVFLIWAFLSEKIFISKGRLILLAQRVFVFGAAGALGLAFFAILRLVPAFGSLFGRSTDFTYSLQDILGGEWRSSLNNFPKVLSWLSTYMRPELLSFVLFALLFSRQKMLHGKILLSGFVWALPLLILGKVLHARYFLPVAPFLTVSAALFFSEVWELVKEKKENLYATTAFALLVLFFLIGCLRFQFFAFFSPSQTPFVLDDREQYLTEWSSGHGIPEVRDLLIQRSRAGERTTVVTEGSFGTLPDGLFLYFDSRPEIEFLRIEGLAQYPVKTIPEWVRLEAQTTETWLVVNAHRMAIDPKANGLELIARYPRPYGAPDLQVYRVEKE